MSYKIAAIALCILFAKFSSCPGESVKVLPSAGFISEESSNTSEHSYDTELSGVTSRKSSVDSEFPPNLFTKDQLRNGAVILYLLGALYSFGVIGIVCGDYFLPSVDCICTDLNLSQDVAAATFMSFATTAPELFIIIIATFISNSDIGVGTVVGGGMFNILGVATIGGLAARMPIKLDWWPLYRDSIAYMFTPVGVSVIVSDGIVTLDEALCLIFYYFLYFIIMLYNRSIKIRVKTWVKKFREKRIRNDESSTSRPPEKHIPSLPAISLTIDEVATSQEATKDGKGLEIPGSEDSDDTSFKAFFMNYDDSISLRRTSACSNASSRSRKKSDRSLYVRRPSMRLSAPAMLGENLHFVSPNLPDCVDKKTTDDLNIGASEFEIGPCEGIQDSTPMSLFTLPEGSFWKKVIWFVLWPSSFALNYTIPDCRSEMWRRYYPLTFLMCVLWIGVSCYFGTWMISVVGETIGISESVMGLTFLALGGSMPEAISTFIMSRQGEGGLGFSNSLGGNTMDICLCLGLPWAIKCVIEGPVVIKSDGLQYNSCSLVLGIIVLLSIATHTKFYMNKKMGFVCCIFYFVFIILSVLIEMGVIVIER